MIRPVQLAPIVFALGLVSGSAHAALQGRDLNGSAGSFEAYYDTDLDITWLADANYAKTSGYDTDGVMTWADANAWAASLSFTNGGNTYNNWRLPTALNQDETGPCSGYNCPSSEMGHLFYSELGGTAGQFITTSSDPDLAKFTNLNGYHYWSASKYAPVTNGAWSFGFDFGYQNGHNESNGFYALAVSSGDVAAVPEVQTYALMLAGLGLIGWRVPRRE